MTAVWNRLNIDLLLTQLVAWLPSLVAAVLMLVAFWILYRATRPTLARVLAKSGFDNALVLMLLSVYRFTLLVFALTMAASQLGINVGAALAGLGVVGLTIGFAAKDSLGNIMAGFLIFWDKPFRVGDWVTLEDKYGQIAEITMRTTRMRTRNNTWVIVPNEAVINRVLTNHSTHGKTRIEVPVGIAYKESIADVRPIILSHVASLPGILADPSPSVVVKELGPSSVNLAVYCWVADAADERPMFGRILETVKNALDENGIEIPYPHMQLSLETVDDQVWKGALSVVRDDS
jgi:small conductance mechanosensitive channel